MSTDTDIIRYFLERIDERLIGVQPYSSFVLSNVYEPERLDRLRRKKLYAEGVEMRKRNIMIGVGAGSGSRVYSVFYYGEGEGLEHVIRSIKAFHRLHAPYRKLSFPFVIDVPEDVKDDLFIKRGIVISEVRNFEGRMTIALKR